MEYEPKLEWTASKPEASEEPEKLRFSVPDPATRKEFLELPENKKMKKRIRTNAVICYIVIAVNAVIVIGAVSLAKLPFSALVLPLALLLLFLVLVIGVHKRQSLVCGLLIGAVLLIEAVTGLIEGGASLGLADLAFLGLFTQTVLLETEWKKYRQNRAQAPRRATGTKL